MHTIITQILFIFLCVQLTFLVKKMKSQSLNLLNRLSGMMNNDTYYIYTIVQLSTLLGMLLTS